MDSSNGAYKNTIIVREVDDTYIFIPNSSVVLMNQYDFPSFEDIVKQKPNYNIFIDSRSFVLILYSILRFGDSTHVYNITDRTVRNIYSFIGSYYKVANEKISLYILKTWAMLMYIDSVCLNKTLNIKPNELLHYLLLKNKNPNALYFNFCIDTMGSQVQSKSINKTILSYVQRYMTKLIDSFNKKNYDIKPIDMNKADDYHIRRILELLYNQGYCINI